MLSSSASRLAKAFCCGKMAQISRHVPDSEHESSTTDFTKYQIDGNLRHAIMEYYLQNVASRKLSLEGSDIKGLVKGEKWDSLNSFLQQKNADSKLGEIDKLNCMKKIKKLKKTIDYLSKYFSDFGRLIHVGAEVNLDLGSPIILSEHLQIEKGEIDAVFVFEHESGDLEVCVIDWKRNLSNKESLSQYKSQCQVYLRCIQQEPSLVGLSKEQISMANFYGYLVEIGGDEATNPEVVKVSNEEKEINTFLQLAVSRFNSSEENPGGHCSLWCKWAFANEYCNSVKPEHLAVNFQSDEFWQQSKFHNKWINSMVQFTINEQTILETGGKNIVSFDSDRKLQLKNIKSYCVVERNTVVRIEGSIVRKTPKLAILNVKKLKLL